MPRIAKHGWSVEYHWSASSGLVLGACEYLGVRVLHDAAVPFVYVDYAGDAFGPFTDELRSTNKHVERREIMGGFDLKASYDLYGDDYLYEHVWRFMHDGQFASKVVIQGPVRRAAATTSTTSRFASTSTSMARSETRSRSVPTTAGRTSRARAGRPRRRMEAPSGASSTAAPAGA